MNNNVQDFLLFHSMQDLFLLFKMPFPPHQRKNPSSVGYAPGGVGREQGCKLLSHRDFALGTEPRRNDCPVWRKGAWPESQES